MWKQWNLGGVILPLVKLKKYDLYLWGIGDNFDSILSCFAANDVSIKGIISTYKEKTYNGVPVILPDELNSRDMGRVYVVVTDPKCFYVDKDKYRGKLYKMSHWLCSSLKINPEVRDKLNPIVRRHRQQVLKKALGKCGVQNYYFLKSSEYEEMCMGAIAICNNRSGYYRKHLNELKNTYDMLHDEISKETLVEFIRVFLQNGRCRILECDGRNKYFAGYGRNENTELLYEHKSDEVWVNCGASVGDSILMYFAEGYTAKRIYAFEGSRAVYQTLCRNIEQLPEGLRKTVTPINKFISEGTGWDSDVREKITLINADIEGYELELLHSMKDKIRSDRPVLAICAYHRNEDLIELPKFLSQTVDSYIYILRKYPCTIQVAINTSELVLYAIPKEKMYVGINSDDSIAR